MGLRDYIAWAAKQYGANAGVLDGMAKFESTYNPGVQNNWDSNASAGTPSYGLMQFIQPTFNSFAKQAKAANPTAWKNFDSMNWKDPYQQSLTAAWAIKNGYGSHWATYDRAQDFAANDYNYQPKWSLGGGGGATGPMGGSGGMGVQNAPMAPANLTNAQKNLLATPTDNQGGDLMPGGRITSIVDMMKGQAAMPMQMASGGGSAPQVGTETEDGPVLETSADGWYRTPKGWVKPRGENEAGWRFLQRLGTGFGLQNDAGNYQTTGGSHSAGSNHYTGDAIDYGDAKNSRESLIAFAKYLAQNADRVGLDEAVYNPMGWGFDGGDRQNGLSWGGHDDHLHTSVF